MRNQPVEIRLTFFFMAAAGLAFFFSEPLAKILAMLAILCFAVGLHKLIFGGISVIILLAYIGFFGSGVGAVVGASELLTAGAATGCIFLLIKLFIKLFL